jgi:NRPS condensation-like uncharacterized protein
MKDYQNKLGAFAHKLKTEPAPVPLQKVEPVTVSEVNNDPDVQFNTEIPKSLRKQLKAHSNEYDLSLKDITITALKLYLQNQQKTTH